MNHDTDNSHQEAAVCLIQADSTMQKQFSALLNHLDLPVISFRTADQFLDLCGSLNIGCIMVDGDELGADSERFIEQLARLGLTGITIIIARQANIDDAVKALQCGIADYLEIPQPDRLLLAKLGQVMANSQNAAARPMPCAASATKISD